MEKQIENLKNLFAGRELSPKHLMTLVIDGIKHLHSKNDLSGVEKKQVLLKTLDSMTTFIPHPEKDILSVLIKDVVPFAIDHFIKAYKTDPKNIVNDS